MGFDSLGFLALGEIPATPTTAQVSGGIFPRRRIQVADSEDDLIVLLAEYEYMMQ